MKSQCSLTFHSFLLLWFIIFLYQELVWALYTHHCQYLIFDPFINIKRQNVEKEILRLWNISGSASIDFLYKLGGEALEAKDYNEAILEGSDDWIFNYDHDHFKAEEIK